MKKIAILSISLLMLIVAIGCASAADINGTVDDSIHTNHQCAIDEITNATPEAVQDVNVVADNTNASAVAGETQTVQNANVIKDSPKHIDTTPEKQNSLKKDIAKYNRFFDKNTHKKIGDGKSYSAKDLVLEIYRHYSPEDTVIIATNVLRDHGFKLSFSEVQAMMYQMIDGTLYTQKYEMNSTYYKNEMQKAQDFHKSITSEAKKYSELFTKKNGKTFVSRPDCRYCYLDLIVEVYRHHSSVDETILIATHALQNCGYNVTPASVEDILNQMDHYSLKTEKGQLDSYLYATLIDVVKFGHDSGNSNAFIFADNLYERMNL